MNRSALATIVVGVMLAWPVGCIETGSIDANVLNRYQQAMVRKGPQQRSGAEGMEQLRPAPGTTGPELKVDTVEVEPGKARPQVRLPLDEAVMRALANNLDIRVVSYDPAMSREEMVKAAAAFDLAVFGAASYRDDDKMTYTPSLPSRSELSTYQAGIKQHAVTGADWSLAWTLTRTWDNSAYSMMPLRFEPTMVLSVTQPLLRNAWPDYNLSKLRIAGINTKVSQAQFRAQVEQTVADVVWTYWSLWQARREVEILRGILKEATDTRQIVKTQYEEGATAAFQVAQVESAVKTREAAVARARKNIVDLQDKLARLLADAQLATLGEGDYEIDPLSPPLEEQMTVDATGQLVMALQHNPVLEQARLGIALADVNVRVAENQTLPKLDLSASAGMQGLDETVHGASREFWSRDYISYNVGLMLEHPLGNRGAIAELRRSQLARQKAVAQMQNVADQLALAIRERIRQINTSYEELRKQRDAATAARAYVDGLKALSDPKAGKRMDPVTLFMVLQAQDATASAERLYLAAVVAYNSAITDLAKTTGTLLELHRIRLAAASGDADWPVPTVQPTTLPAGPSRPATTTVRP